MNVAYKSFSSVILSALYSVVSVTVFVALLAIACLIPPLIALLLYFIFSLFVPGLAYVFIIGAAYACILTISSLWRSIYYATSVPQQEYNTEDLNLIKVTKRVAQDIGVAPFYSVSINSELDVYTFYIGQRRCLNLSVIVLAYLTEDEVKAVVSHECAHHHHHAMLLHRTHYRTTIFFESFADAVTNVFMHWNKVTDTRRGAFGAIRSGLLTNGILILLPLLGCVYVYRYFLSSTGVLLKDSEYEYYCDDVAAKYVGGNILASALQKIVDLHIAHYRVLKMKDYFTDSENLHNKSNERLYLEILDREFKYIRYFNPPDRVEAGKQKTDTHPPLASRLKRAQVISTKVDLSKPLSSRLQALVEMEYLPKSSFVEFIEKEIAHRNILKETQAVQSDR